MIRIVRIEDAKAICDIYNYYVLNAIATFVERPFTVAEMELKINSIHPKFPWLVYEKEGVVIGYAYANAWNERSAYKKSVESTIYLKTGIEKQGIGTKLYTQLIEIIKSKGFHVMIGGISLPNKGSQKLHENLGFKKAAHYKEIGFKFNSWIDVGYWQLIIKD
jgi:phosphinothricin acetyltransferase